MENAPTGPVRWSQRCNKEFSIAKIKWRDKNFKCSSPLLRCVQCNKSFSQAANLTAHCRTHRFCLFSILCPPCKCRWIFSAGKSRTTVPFAIASSPRVAASPRIWELTTGTGRTSKYCEHHTHLQQLLKSNGKNPRVVSQRWTLCESNLCVRVFRPSVVSHQLQQHDQNHHKYRK